MPPDRPYPAAVSLPALVSAAVGLSVLLGSVLAVGRYVGRLEEHLTAQDNRAKRQDRQIAAMRRQLSRVHAAVTDEGELREHPS